ncbi:MAG: hypothetical protein JWN44_843 [Myxococcales bacterium]|nr:hypothetical protein [Myxococcales bacterium]
MARRAILFVLCVAALGCRRPPGPALSSPFRFSPRPNRAAEIHWRTWEPSLFVEAQRSGKPILLSLSAVWCHWCHVLDETTLSDPRVIALLNRDFLTVRVDADQHPDIERRYILGGWPTVAFLTAKGEIVDGGTYVPPADFLTMATGALALVRAGGADLEQRLQRRRGSRDATAPGALDATIVEGVARTLTAAADPIHGGFGEAPKFPNGEAVLFLLEVGEVDVARRALDGMLELEDRVAGGFFRYATRADWSAPHYEKMLQGNAELLTAYARGFAVTKDERYRAAARRTVAWVEHTLFDAQTGTFYASQDADEKYYAADAAGRAALQAPYVDRTLLVDRAALMVSALVAAARDLDEPSMLGVARAGARALMTMRGDDGRFQHARRAGEQRSVQGELADQAHAALALLSLAAVTPTAEGASFRDAARRAIASTVRTLRSPDGSFYDADAANEGLLVRRERPLVENAVMARAQLAAGHVGDAERTLSAFAGAYLLHGTEAAGYARAVDALLRARRGRD